MFKYICICCDTTRATYTQTNKIIWAISKNQAIKKFKSKFKLYDLIYILSPLDRYRINYMSTKLTDWKEMTKPINL